MVESRRVSQHQECGGKRGNAKWVATVRTSPAAAPDTDITSSLGHRYTRTSTMPECEGMGKLLDPPTELSRISVVWPLLGRTCNCIEGSRRVLLASCALASCGVSTVGISPDLGNMVLGHFGSVWCSRNAARTSAGHRPKLLDRN